MKPKLTNLMMKINQPNMVFLFVFTLFTFLPVSAQDEKIIENPSFEVTNNGQHDISKIVFSAAETRIFLHTTLYPDSWVKFSKDIFIKELKTGKKHTLISVEGADFGEPIQMDASGEKINTLIFPPLKKGIKKIDYNNMIFGVSLEESDNQKSPKKESNKIPEYVSEWIKTELSKVSEEPLPNLDSNAFFRKGKGRLIGYLKGYDPRLGFTTGIIYTNNEITREEYPVVIEIHPDGRFEANVPLIHPLHSYFILNEQWLPFYLEPGQTLAVILQWEDFLVAERERSENRIFKDIVYKGKLAKVNKDLLGFDLSRMKYKHFKERLTTSSPEAFKKEQLDIQKNNFNKLSAYIEVNTISPKAATLLKGKILLRSGTRLFDFVANRKYARRKDSLNETLKIPAPDNYYNFLKDMPLNEQSLLALNSFRTFVNRFEFSDPFGVVPTELFSAEPEVSVLEFFEEIGVSLTEEEKELHTFNGDIKNYVEFNKKRRIFFKKYKSEMDSYREKYVWPLQALKGSLERWRLKDSVLTNKLGLKNNLVYDVTKIRTQKFSLERFNRNGANIYWNKIQATIENEFLKKEGNRIFREVFPKIKENTGLDNSKMSAVVIERNSVPLPEGKAARIFKEIVEPYQGKILFVDFWATTCGPCVGTIKRMKEVREKYKDHKDFEFVFITGERISPQPSYDKFVKEQELENIHRISVDDYLYLRQLFKFNGIPQYIVIGKNGNLINGDFRMYNFHDELPKILKKHK